MERWNVDAGHSGLTLMAFLRERLGPAVSAKQIKRAVDSGFCLLNGRAERFASRLVGKGDIIECDPAAAQPRRGPLVDDAKRVLFADDTVVAYDKPAGVASDSETLHQWIEKRYPGSILLHRLDKDTTGVLLFARTREAADAIEAQFKQRKVKKSYLALVDGAVKEPRGTIDNALAKISTYQGQSLWGEVAADKGLRARTDWEAARRGGGSTLMICRPLTGRTHQIRVHMSGMGHPILGDAQYGRVFKCPFRPGRCLLHASEVAFEHPVTGKTVVISAPLPEDFNSALIQLMGEK
jgi:RluA family pseudouridine synthase